jgi:putative oxygen-independent coproporphyrinogen III oxidase
MSETGHYNGSPRTKKASMQHTDHTIPLSLYLHFPWCVRKCPYCDFNSHTLTQTLPEMDYVEAMLTELKQHATVLQARPIHSIFLGGGTPSLFSPASLSRLFDGLTELATLTPATEITLEANPGTSDSAYFHGYRELGINRISLGVQSFDPAKLAALGRIHTGDDALRAVEILKQAGFTNFNIDLMYGLPQQDSTQACADLELAVSTGASHISWYQLTIEPNTVFYHKPPADRAENEALWDIECAGKNVLAQHGFQAYEVSAYAQNARYCQHNLNYWHFGDYLGIGAGAHSKLTTPHAITRWRNQRMPKDYLNPTKEFSTPPQTLNPAEQAFEFFMNHWRLFEPTPLLRLAQRTQATLDSVRAPLNAAVARGLLELSPDQIQVTPLGQRYLNDLLTLFLPEA